MFDGNSNYSNLCRVFLKLQMNLENYCNNKHVSINKIIVLTAKAAASKQYSSAPNNVPNKPKIPWTTAKQYSNWLSDSKRTWFYIAKKFSQTRTKKLERINKCWIEEQVLVSLLHWWIYNRKWFFNSPRRCQFL